MTARSTEGEGAARAGGGLEADGRGGLPALALRHHRRHHLTGLEAAPYLESLDRGGAAAVPGAYIEDLRGGGVVRVGVAINRS